MPTRAVRSGCRGALQSSSVGSFRTAAWPFVECSLERCLKRCFNSVSALTFVPLCVSRTSWHTSHPPSTTPPCTGATPSPMAFFLPVPPLPRHGGVAPAGWREGLSTAPPTPWIGLRGYWVGWGVTRRQGGAGVGPYPWRGGIPFRLPIVSPSPTHLFDQFDIGMQNRGARWRLQGGKLEI